MPNFVAVHKIVGEPASLIIAYFTGFHLLIKRSYQKFVPLVLKIHT